MTKALEKTYDGIIIGAGHHGVILGSYLAKAFYWSTGACNTAAASLPKK